jgi:hypothetical protein
MRFVAVACVLFFASVASAQLVFQPIQYQYGGQNPFYYGGSNPLVIARGNYPSCGEYGRVHGWAFISANGVTHREVGTEPLRVYADCVGRGFTNARVYGYSIEDARNEAYSSVPLVFRMRDLVAHAEPTSDGTWVVPPTAPYNDGHGTIEIKPYVRPAPSSNPHPVLIIPKKLLEEPAPSPKKVALWDRPAAEKKAS